ncbi:MAG: DUF4143 domain-containing protein [Thermoanaerobaculia bacterium]
MDTELERRLAASGAVVIEGPKACGKTETGRRHSASEVLLDVDANARQAVAVAPATVLDGPTPRLLDEWQTVPAIWNHVRRAVDERKDPGQFILTGSAVPADDVTRHTGAGRLSRLRMRTLSLYEMGYSSGAVSLQRLFEGGAADAVPDPGATLEDVTRLLVRGGWPGMLEADDAVAAEGVVAYLDEVCRIDVSRVDEIRRDPEGVRRLTRSLARNVGTPVKITNLAADAGDADGPLSRDAVAEYLRALERLMIVEDQPAWAPHLRSRSRLRSTAKRHFSDPSLAVAALGATPRRLLGDLNYLGLLFESLVVRDLRVYAQPLRGRVLHYRDNTGLEADAVVELPDGRWVACEVKLGGVEAIDEAAATLSTLAERVDTSRCGDPAALVVVVATGYGYRRDDGVLVCPIVSLGP